MSLLEDLLLKGKKMNDFAKADKILEQYRIENKNKLEKRKQTINKEIPEYETLTNKIRLLNISMIKNIKSSISTEEDRDKQELEKLKEKRKKL